MTIYKDLKVYEIYNLRTMTYIYNDFYNNNSLISIMVCKLRKIESHLLSIRLVLSFVLKQFNLLVDFKSALRPFHIFVPLYLNDL